MPSAHNEPMRTSSDISTRRRVFAVYVSGHGFGHASVPPLLLRPVRSSPRPFNRTRASALTTTLLTAGHSVYIVTNAPPQPFSAVLPPAAGSALVSASPALPEYATYRKASVDAGIVQPKAYDVDRKATYEVLKAFMHEREQRLVEEEAWLRSTGIEVVLSDATFLGWYVTSPC